MKNKKNGITLIALIITVIVMLILVGVTINVALNGGLFSAAEGAVNDTQRKAEEEQLLSAIVTAYETETGIISKSKLEADLGADWKVEGAEGGPYTITSPKGNIYTVTENGTIEYKGKTEKEELDPSALTDLEKYIYGADGKGRDLNQIMDMDTSTFKQDPADTNSSIYENIKLAYVEETKESEIQVSIRYNRDVYKFTVKTIDENNESGVLITKPEKLKGYTPEGNLGKYVTYQGKSWIVLYDDADKVELISTEALGEVTLGGSDFETGKNSYNNVIETLTEACKIETGISTGIRSVGGPTEEVELDKATKVTLSYLKSKGFEPQADKETEINELIKDIRQEDENYLADYNQMKTLGILLTDTDANACYWFASRLVYLFSYEEHFNIRYLEGPYMNSDYLCGVSRNAYNYGRETSNSVRPVIILDAGILNGKTEEGTSSNPINLDSNA